MDNSKFIPSQPEVEPKPKSKTELIKFFIIASVLLVFGIGGALATKVWNPWWNPFRPSPNKVIEKMTKAMEGVKTVHSKMEFEITAFENGEKTAGFKGSMEGDSDVQDLEKPKADVKFDFDIRTEGSEYFIGFELRQTAKDLYFKPKTLPVFLTQIVLPMTGIDWQELQNQWIRVNASELEKMYPDLFPQKEESQEHQQDIQNKLKEMIENKKFYLVKKTLPDEQINGKDSYHYLVALDREAIKQIISDMVFSEEFKNEMGQAVEIEKEEILKNLDQFFEKMGELEAELWIDKKDYYLCRFRGEKKINLNDLASEQPGLQENLAISLRMNIDYSNYNEPVKIEPPVSYKNIEDAFGRDFLEGFLRGYFQ